MAIPPELAGVILLASGMILSAALCPSEGKEFRTVETKITEKSGLERIKEDVKKAQQKTKKDGQEAGREFKESNKELHDTAKKEFKKNRNRAEEKGEEWILITRNVMSKIVGEHDLKQVFPANLKLLRNLLRGISPPK